MMADRPPLTLGGKRSLSFPVQERAVLDPPPGDNVRSAFPTDGSSEGNPPDTSLHSPYSHDFAQEGQESPHHHQVNHENIKGVKEEPEEPYVRGDERHMEEEISPEIPMGSTQEGYNPLHHDQDGNLVVVKQEEESGVRDGERGKEEEISPHTSGEWGLTRDAQEQPLNMLSNGEIKRDAVRSDSSEGNVTTANLHPAPREEKSFSCCECGVRFVRKRQLISHERAHRAERSSLIAQRKAHRGEKPYLCPECGKCFVKNSKLIEHKRTHTGEKPYLCSECGKCFAQKSNLNAHKKTHTGKKPYSCSECGRCFSKKAVLIRHEQVHTGKKPYSCSECGKCFSQKAMLIRHDRVHAGENSYSGFGTYFAKKIKLTENERTPSVEKYSCFECGKCFVQKSNLNEHKKTHTGEKPYSCAECGRSFSQKAVLNRHERVHTGEKPYACFECGKCFSHKSNLTEHKRSHTGEKPYSCSECGKCFSTSSSLIHHKKSHSG